MIQAFWMILVIAALLSSAYAANPASTGHDGGISAAQAMLAAGDYAQAFDLYHAADHHPLAQFSLAQFYQNGWGRAVDRAMACTWFERAAQNGIPAAQHMTGLCYEAGTHRPADPSAAAGWFHKAAQAGHLSSYCHLGNLMMIGNGIAKDPANALELCHSAALQGSIPAQIWMGKFYLYGDPSVRNPENAYKWLLAAAQKQSGEAFYHLGMMLSQGVIANHDAAQSRLFFEQAAALKYIPAYFKAGTSFFAAEPDAKTKRLSADNLAKAYLWISAAIEQSANSAEIAAARTIRQQILAMMPLTWVTELDGKIAQHIQNSK